MKTGKVEHVPDDLDDRLLFCDSSPTQERIAEHQRLQSAVVEAAREWWNDGSIDALHDTMDALIAFEAEHKIGE
jgi:hypothetical protein